MSWSDNRQSPTWGATDAMIDAWLQERQALLVSFSSLSRLPPFNDQPLPEDALQTFCGLLVDYVSKGHFEMFEKLAEAGALQATATWDRDILVQILQTTMVALHFHDRYTQTAPGLNHLSQDLSQLGEELAQRMDLEDKLIHAYLLATSQLQSSPPRATR